METCIEIALHCTLRGSKLNIAEIHKMKKLLMVDPTFNPGNIPPNLGLGKIESALASYEIDIELKDFILPNCHNMSLSEFKQAEDLFVKQVVEATTISDIVYISGSHGMELKPYAMFPRIAKISTEIKKKNRNIPIIFGGALAMFYTDVHKIPGDKFKIFGIDRVVSGQEKGAARIILQACGVEEKKLFVIKKQDLLSSNSSVTGGISSWNAWDLSKYPDYMSLMVQTGCPYQCSFCFEGKVYEPQNPQSTLNDLIEGLRVMRTKKDINGLMIEDSIALSFPWFQTLTASLAEENVPWAIYVRSTEIIKKQRELDDIIRAGCRSAIVGIESLDDSELQATEKRVSARQNIEALEIAKQAGLAIQGCFILGFPTDTVDECTKRVEAALKFGLSTFRWHIMQPDWANLPEGIMGAEGFDLSQHFTTQVSMPDSCLLEAIENPSTALVYDEHILIRLISQGVDDLPQLSRYGYKGNFNLREMFKGISPLIRSSNYPLNEDDMYPYLFNPNYAKNLLGRELK